VTHLQYWYISSTFILKNPMETAVFAKDIIVRTFKLLGQVFTTQDNLNLNMPTTIVLMSSVALFGITFALGNQLYTRYIATIIKLEVLPPISGVISCIIDNTIVVCNLYYVSIFCSSSFFDSHSTYSV
jgi:hypothetical protein